MAYRKRPALLTHVAESLLDEVRRPHEEALAAQDAFKVRLYVAVEQGVTTREIADATGLSQASVSRYRIQGQTLHHERLRAAE